LVGISFLFLGVLIYSKKPATLVVQATPMLPNAKTIVQPSTKIVSIHTETVSSAAVVEQN
jgi:hypothetical protein